VLRSVLDLADNRFVNLDHFASAAHRGEPAVAEGFTKAMHHEPGRLVRDAKRAMDLMGGNTLLRGREKEQGGQPLRERDFGTLEYGLDRDGELLANGASIILLVSAWPPDAPTVVRSLWYALSAPSVGTNPFSASRVTWG
jgi:hypothetical protein